MKVVYARFSNSAQSLEVQHDALKHRLREDLSRGVRDVNSRKNSTSSTNQDLRDKGSRNFRTPTNFKYSLLFSSKLGRTKKEK